MFSSKVPQVLLRTIGTELYALVAISVVQITASKYRKYCHIRFSVSEMTYTVSSGMLNSTSISYHTIYVLIYIIPKCIHLEV